MRFGTLISSFSVAGAFLMGAALPTETHEFKIGNVTTRDTDTVYNGQFTWFVEGGTGACGGQNTNSEFVVALNTGQFQNGHCWDLITISYDGKSTTAAIVDECPGCPEWGLDLTEGLFTYLAGSLDVGVIYGTWSYQ